MVVVAARFDENGVVLAVAAGVTGFLRRADATSARLVEVIRQADRAGCQLPEGCCGGRPASSCTRCVPRPDVIRLSEPARASAGPWRR